MPNLPIKTGHVFIGLAVIMGVATVGVFSNSKHDNRKAQAKIETMDVVVPLTPINEGATLSRNDVTLVKWPAAFLPKGATFNDPYKVVGRIAKQNLYPGEPIFAQKISGTKTKGGLTALIPDGMRAITIPVTEVKGVAGFVKPGDRVDVLTTFDLSKQDGGSDSAKRTKTVLQDVLVLASAQNMVDDNQINMDTPDGVTRGEATPESSDDLKKDKDTKSKEKKLSPQELEKQAKDREKEKKEAEKAAKLVSSVTLALLPEQAETMALAEETGKLHLVLRPEADHSIAKLSGQDSDKLAGQSTPQELPHHDVAPPPPPKTPAPMPTPYMGAEVEFIQGGDKTLYNFNQ